MRYAADLHLHSRYASGVSSAMTVETIALWARRKGIDVIGTGDCLQPTWLEELGRKLVPAEPGWWVLCEELEAPLLAQLPPRLQQPLRFVLSTEVCCAPPGTGHLHGVHHLIYFPSFASARQLQQHLHPWGDLHEGRPTLRMTSRELLACVCEQNDGAHLAPAHVMNPYFSSLGSQERRSRLNAWFGDLTPQLLAVETGLTSNPAMCRRLSFLDPHGLFSCSDAHSPENIGRECTLLDTEPGYAPLFAALRQGSRPAVLGTFKYPLKRTRYYLNRCGVCSRSFEGVRCPQCGGRLAMGSRDRLEQLADRTQPRFPPDAPPFREHLPLKDLLAEFCGLNRTNKEVNRLYHRLLSGVGHERFILTEASVESLAEASAPPLAQAILAQRETASIGPARPAPTATAPPPSPGEQLGMPFLD